MAANALGNLVNYSDDDESGSETNSPPRQPSNDKPQNHKRSHSSASNIEVKRSMDVDDSHRSKKSTPPPMSNVKIHSKPTARPASLPQSAPAARPQNVHGPSTLAEVDTPMDMDLESEDEQLRKRRELMQPKPIPNVDDWGIPPEPQGECDADVEARIAHFLSLRESGTRFNEHLQHSKAFRNPHIYEKLVEFVELDEYSSNFPKDQFDPHGFGTDIDGLLEAQKKSAEDRLLSQQHRSNIQFVSGGPPAGPPPTIENTDKFADAVARAAQIASKLSSQARK
ncbi:unnamed protein product [Umbelopsis sp. WA50703]